MIIKRPPRSDVIFATIVLVAAQVEVSAMHLDHSEVARITGLVASVALAYRRLYPVAVAIVCVLSQTVNAWLHVDISELLAPVVWITVSIYTMARYCSLRRALAGEAVLVALFCTTLFDDYSDWFFASIVNVIPFLVGRAFRSKAGETEELTERVSEMEQQREEELAAALSEERARIARDLHDVIAHSVTVMLVQAGAAQEVLRREPDRAVAALDSVQEAGRQALTEMGTLVGMLHEDGDGVGLSPQPGLDQLAPLVSQASVGGLEVSLDVVGTPYPVSPGVQVSLYRVVQESLTNVRKHSTAAHARVRLTYAAGAVGVEVCDDGVPTGTGHGSQRGLVGMRERVEIYGGELEAGSVGGQGYRVRARVPVEVLA